MDVAVVGGGAVGVTVAHDLAPDADVTLYEADELAAGASSRAAGICYDAFSDRRDATLGRRALDRFRDLAGSGGFTFESCPYLWLARNGDERRARQIRETAARMREHDLSVTTLEAAELGDRFPGLVTENVAVTAIAEDAGYADPEAYTQTLGLLARAKDATIEEQTPVTLTPNGAVATDTRVHDHDAVVVAAGAHTKDVVAAVAPLSVKPYRVQALVTAAADISPPILYDATGGFYLRPHEDGILVGNGTEPVEQDPDDWDHESDTAFREACIEYQERALGWSWPEARSWAGLCTATPDGDPLVGHVAEDVYVATGWQGHGFMRAPAVGERLAAQVLGDRGAIAGFDPNRFDGDESFDIVEGMALEQS